MGLELVLQEAPHTGATIDVYTSGLARMYTGIGGSPNGPPAWMMDPMQQPQNNWMPEYNQPMQGFDTPGGFQTTLPQYIQSDPIHISEHLINRPYGDHENKLIDFNTGSNTTVYSSFGTDSLRLDIFHNEHGVSHRDKLFGMDVELPYIEQLKLNIFGR
ncbi:MAG: hypothetical protein AABW92_00750 [Nanoarchaeota archaeon]